MFILTWPGSETGSTIWAYLSLYPVAITHDQLTYGLLTHMFLHAGGFLAGVVLALPLFLRRGGPRFWARIHGRPPHPQSLYSRIPRVTRR